ncbi:hypothetical protein LDO51_11015 [Providencia alcalifaciens]|uniref:hypothetical protein n=1 Tax=Providencia alcalifaciens TaxID=126385 RepID=UPI001CE0719A|nr:hypothetical protein [Providencia alcalifaciens]UBX47726.1 hypothetical protein LDO51_11015 [Providencia alcalifaciens]
MKKLLLALFIPFFSYANGNNLENICRIEKGTYLAKRTVLEYNATNIGYINYRVSGKGSVWYYIQPSAIQGINFMYDILKVAYLTQQPVNVCILSNGDTLGIERKATSS